MTVLHEKRGFALLAGGRAGQPKATRQRVYDRLTRRIHTNNGPVFVPAIMPRDLPKDIA